MMKMHYFLEDLLNFKSNYTKVFSTWDAEALVELLGIRKRVFLYFYLGFSQFFFAKIFFDESRKKWNFCYVKTRALTSSLDNLSLAHLSRRFFSCKSNTRGSNLFHVKL